MGFPPMVNAVAASLILGAPFLLWGYWMIADRDRSWRVQQKRDAERGILRERTPGWDRRQQIYGSMLIVVGLLIMAGFMALNVIYQ